MRKINCFKAFFRESVCPKGRKTHYATFCNRILPHLSSKISFSVILSKFQSKIRPTPPKSTFYSKLNLNLSITSSIFKIKLPGKKCSYSDPLNIRFSKKYRPPNFFLLSFSISLCKKFIDTYFLEKPLCPFYIIIN